MTADSPTTIAERALLDGFPADLEPFVFYGGWASNFSRHGLVLPHPWTGIPMRYPTGEHRFQAMKAACPEDHDFVLAASTPSVAKDRGRSIELRAGWGSSYGDLCWFTMTEVTTAKALQNAGVRIALAQTGRRPIYEDSPTDDIWGVRAGAVFTGKNLLGRSWMWTRHVLGRA